MGREQGKTQNCYIASKALVCFAIRWEIVEIGGVRYFMGSDYKSKRIDRSKLRDISSVQIDMSLPQQERIKSFVEQIGNPYCYLDGDIVVSIGYANTDVSLQDRLRAYLSSLI